MKWGDQKTKSAKSVATFKIHEPVTLGLRLALGGFVQIFTILLSSQMDRIQNTYFLDLLTEHVLRFCWCKDLSPRSAG